MGREKWKCSDQWYHEHESTVSIQLDFAANRSHPLLIPNTSDKLKAEQERHLELRNNPYLKNSTQESCSLPRSNIRFRDVQVFSSQPLESTDLHWS